VCSSDLPKTPKPLSNFSIYRYYNNINMYNQQA